MKERKLYISINRHGGYNMPRGFWEMGEKGSYPVVIFRRPKSMKEAEYIYLLEEIQKLWESK